MNEMLSDDEQVERLKTWWKANGSSIIAGVVIGLGGFFAWQWWGSYQDQLAGEGAEAYEKFAQIAAAGDLGKTDDALAQLQSDFGGSSYYEFAAMELARQQANAGSLEAAEKTLNSVMQNATDKTLKPLLKIRLARLLLSQQRFDEAEQLLGSVKGDGYAGEVAAIRGIIAFKQGRLQEARAAFEQAQQQGSNDENVSYLLEEINARESS